MAFEQQWEEYQAKRATELQVLIEQARTNWLGRRVWCWSLAEWLYGEVVEVDDQGSVRIDYAPNPRNSPWCRTHIRALGESVILADEWRRGQGAACVASSSILSSRGTVTDAR